MLRRPFREHHLLCLLEQYARDTQPLDLSICNYFRSHKALGAKDRAFIAETIYALVRWQGLLDFLAGGSSCSSSWEKRLELYSSAEFEQAKCASQIPLPTRLSCPEELFYRLVAAYGEEGACAIAAANNGAAPTTIRANALKITREELLHRWQGLYDVAPCQEAQHGIRFNRRINFYELPEFKQGLFEVQDEGSQMVASLVQAEPGQQVLDYCAGSGGKTLAFAPQMRNQGQVHLFDIRKHVLDDSRKRLRRAGIQNAQLIYQDEAKLKRLKKRMDWVLVDAPCSGTGTFRRNPDMKWKYAQTLLKRLVSQQRVIFEKALSFLQPTGKIVFATCSILQEENEQQMDHFVKTYDLEIVAPPYKSLPTESGKDGFFAVTFKRKKLTVNIEST